MKKRWLCIALAVCLILGMLSMAALAEEAHDHTGWTAVAMNADDPTKINIDGEMVQSNALAAGNYYLAGDLTVALSVSGAVNLCLNGHSITASGSNTITVLRTGSLTLCDCGSGGKVAYGGSGQNYGIYNSGAAVLRSGVVESTYCGVYNGSGSFTIQGGRVSGDIYGVYNASSSSRVYLAGSPSVTGGVAGIYTNGSSSAIYANDAAQVPAAYDGEVILLGYQSVSHGNTAVCNVTDANQDRFRLTDENYGLVYDGLTLKMNGVPQELTWYDGDEKQLTGDGYDMALPYGSYLDAADLPAAPTVEGKIFLGWLYRSGDSSGWSGAYWSGGCIEAVMQFKADYIEAFPGSGTQDDPYQIADADGLQKLAVVINRGLTAFNSSGVYYKLTADIDLSCVCGADVGSWTPIGDGSDGFKANFDGGGWSISNLYIDASSDGQGLFGCLSGAAVKDLTVTGSVSAGDCSGALAGKISDSTVENVDVSGVATAPYGYTADSSSTMAYRQSDTAVDVKGNYKGNWIATTSGGGYAIKTSGLEHAAVTVSADFINGGKYVRLSYTVTAGDSGIAGGKLAVYADTRLGDSGEAAIETMLDPETSNVIGLRLVDSHPSCASKNAQLNLYFDGTGGVTPADTYWFGPYEECAEHCFAQLNADSAVPGSGTYWENDAGDPASGSAIALSWQNINLAADESATYCFILGVGEKAGLPVWGGGSDAAHLALTATSGAAQDERLIGVSAIVTDAADQAETLYYSVDGAIGAELGHVEAGSAEKTITGQLDLSGYEDGSYELSFWVVNSAGAASSSVKRTLVIKDGEITEGLDAAPPSPVICTVAFDAQGGSEAGPVAVDCGGVIAELPTTTREGYTFDGWFTGVDGGGDRLTTETVITADIVFYAKWTADAPAPAPTPAPGGSDVIGPVILASQILGGVSAGQRRACSGGKDCPSRAFRDLDVGQWYHKATDFVICNGLMDGSGGEFYPDKSLTRAELAQILYNAEGRPDAPAHRLFTDVEEGAWYFDAVSWASGSGIAAGYPDGTFAPDRPVTREQLALMLFRCAQLKGWGMAQSGMAVRKLSDCASISAYAVDAMTWALDTGVMSGFPDNTLRPQSNAARAQAAQMLKNLFARIEKK